ncbi:hypothetical protein SSPS47_25505 [Streptomyces sp. S4.7]|nr:hypothetical protein SSPS47_25505 [Streptomyces sp. S4.7]
MLVQHVVGMRGGVRAQVGGLHGAGATAGRHGQPRTGQIAAEASRSRVRVSAPRHGVAAHHAHDPCADEEFVQGVRDRVVVDRPQHRGEYVAVGLGALEPLVGEGVRCRLVPALVQPLEELLGGVERAPVRVEREMGDGREDQCPVGPYLRRGVRCHRAAEEDGLGGVGGQQRERTARQVDRLDPEAAERPAQDHLVELVERFDLAVQAVRPVLPEPLGAPGRCLLCFMPVVSRAVHHADTIGPTFERGAGVREGGRFSRRAARRPVRR